MQKWKQLIRLGCSGLLHNFKRCNVQNVSFLGKTRTTASVSLIVRHIKRLTSSTNVTFAATSPPITVAGGTTTACTVTIGRGQSGTNARERRIAR
jgi:hypothetical protein